MHGTRNAEAVHGARQLRRYYDWTDGDACVSVGALAK